METIVTFIWYIVHIDYGFSKYLPKKYSTALKSSFSITHFTTISKVGLGSNLQKATRIPNSP